MPRKVNSMVSLTSYRIQLSSAPCNYKTKIKFKPQSGEPQPLRMREEESGEMHAVSTEFKECN